jgi:FkbM family methyltransferase
MIKEILKQARSESNHITLDELKSHFGSQLDKIVIYGIGASGDDLLKILNHVGISPRYFSDTNAKKWGMDIHGIQCIAPHKILEKVGADVLVFVAITNHLEKHFNAISKLLKKNGIEHIYHATYLRKCPEIVRGLNAQRMTFGIMELDDEKEKRIIEAYALLSDEESKMYFENIFRLRLLDIVPEGYISGGDIDYFSFQYFKQESAEHFVDCGAFTGDTLKEFIGHYGDDYRQYSAFEPDKNNYNLLSNYVCNLGEGTHKGKIVIYNQAVSNKTGFLMFVSRSNHESLGGGGSFVDPCGTEKVDVITLDDSLKDSFPTIIKMDLEGHELSALEGARKIISNYSPILLISAYHKPEDIWEIPLLISSYSKEYQFFLEGNNYNCEFILLAIPKSKVIL